MPFAAREHLKIRLAKSLISLCEAACIAEDLDLTLDLLKITEKYAVSSIIDVKHRVTVLSLVFDNHQKLWYLKRKKFNIDSKDGI